MKICRLLQNLIDWESLNTRISGIVNDGLEALDFIKANKPDIVITDIRMPGYDGIELIHRAREEQIDSTFIIISGYRQFDYAQNAIKYGVEDYLLKPINEKELVDTIQKITRRKDAEHYKTMERKDMEERLKQSSSIARKDFLNRILADNNSIFSNQTQTDLPPVGMDEGRVQAVLFKPDQRSDVGSDETYQAMLRKTDEIITRLFEKSRHSFISAVKDEGVFLIVNRFEEDDKEFLSLLKSIEKEILRQRSLFPSIQLTIGEGSTQDNISEIRVSINQARNAALNRLILGCGGVIQWNDLESEKEETEKLFDNQTRGKLLERIEVFDEEEINTLLDSIGRRLERNENIDGIYIKKLSENIISTYAFGRRNLDIETNADEIQSRFSAIFCRCDSIGAVIKNLSAFIKEDLEALKKTKTQTRSKPIREVKQYLRKHYNEAIRQEDMSAMVGFNTTYFSSLFKKETGETFSDYLIRLRVSRAKEFLTASEYPIADIAEEVGYQDLKYFSRIFKRETGLNPSDYRKLYRKID